MMMRTLIREVTTPYLELSPRWVGAVSTVSPGEIKGMVMLTLGSSGHKIMTNNDC